MSSTPIQFGEWLPDLPSLGLQGCTVASNVLPGRSSYKSFPGLTQFGTAIGSRAKGGVYATDASNNTFNYCGDTSALYALTQQTFGAVTRVSGAYSLVGDDYWEFANWGNTVIAVNGFTDLPQQISLGGANFADLSVGVKARHIAVMRDFVVLGNVSDSATQVYRVRWSAINNPTDFAPSAATLSDYQDLASEGGPVSKVLGGEYGVILQQRSIWRMSFVGSPLVFQFDRVHNAIGAYLPQAAVRYQNLVFFLSEDGFYNFDGSALNPIGRGKVDEFFFHDMARAYAQRVHAAIDPINKLVLWAYPSGSSNGGNPDKLLCYSWAFQRWTLIEGIDITFLLQSITTGYTLEGLDTVSTNIDTLGTSLDSIQWTGGQIILAAFNATHRLAYFNGSAMAATMQTGEFQLIPDQRAMLTEVRPDGIGLSASLTVTVMNRNNLTESVSVGAVAGTLNATGFVQTRCSARYFHIKLQTAHATDFTHLLGVEVSGVAAGAR